VDAGRVWQRRAACQVRRDVRGPALVERAGGGLRVVADAYAIATAIGLGSFIAVYGPGFRLRDE
jgi:hypothetical protein